MEFIMRFIQWVDVLLVLSPKNNALHNISKFVICSRPCHSRIAPAFLLSGVSTHHLVVRWRNQILKAWIRSFVIKVLFVLDVFYWNLISHSNYWYFFHWITYAISLCLVEILWLTILIGWLRQLQRWFSIYLPSVLLSRQSYSKEAGVFQIRWFYVLGSFFICHSIALWIDF